jgi:hypothetical protein
MTAKLFACFRRTHELEHSGIVVTEIGKIHLMKDSPALPQPLVVRARPGLDERLRFLIPDHFPIPLRFPAREIHGVSPDVFPNGRRVIFFLGVVAGPDVETGDRSSPVVEVAVVPNTRSF